MTLHNAYTPARETLPRLARVVRRKAPSHAAHNDLSRLLQRGVSAGVHSIFASRGGGSAQGGGFALGEKLMENAFDELVAGALSRGRRTSGVLGTLFNLVPALSGR